MIRFACLLVGGLVRVVLFLLRGHGSGARERSGGGVVETVEGGPILADDQFWLWGGIYTYLMDGGVGRPDVPYLSVSGGRVSVLRARPSFSL